MRSEPTEFYTVYDLAKELWGQSRYESALWMFERALMIEGGDNNKRLWAKYWLADCNRMMGRYPKALAILGEIYIELRDKTGHRELAYRCLFDQISCAISIREYLGSIEKTGSDNILGLIEEGLQWLRDIGLEYWRAALLLRRSEVLWSMGEKERALDDAEEAYRLNLEFKDSPGYTLVGYAGRLAHYSQLSGNYERSLQVLDESEEFAKNPFSRCVLRLHRGRVLRKMTSSRSIDIIENARQLARNVEDVENILDRILFYGETALSFIACHSFAEALHTLERAYEVSMKCQDYERFTVLKYAKHEFENCYNSLAEKGENEVARDLYSKLRYWIEETEKELQKIRNPRANQT